MCGRVVKYFKQLYYQYNLETALYMLEPWEKVLFNTLAFCMCSATTYYTYQYVVKPLVHLS